MLDYKFIITFWLNKRQALQSDECLVLAASYLTVESQVQSYLPSIGSGNLFMLIYFRCTGHGSPFRDPLLFSTT
jgi:hypothetical protein